MGKEHLKNISPSRLYSPWQLADNESKNNTGFSMLDVSSNCYHYGRNNIKSIIRQI